MKYIKKIFENTDLVINLEDEFQSIKDIMSIGGDNYFYLEIGNKDILIYDDVEINNSGDYNETTDSIDDLVKKSKFWSEILEEVKHICRRLNDDGFELDISIKEVQIQIKIVGKSSDIKIDKNDINYFLNAGFGQVWSTSTGRRTDLTSISFDRNKFKRWAANTYSISANNIDIEYKDKMPILSFNSNLSNVDRSNIIIDLRKKLKDISFKNKEDNKEYKITIYLDNSVISPNCQIYTTPHSSIRIK